MDTQGRQESPPCVLVGVCLLCAPHRALSSTKQLSPGWAYAYATPLDSGAAPTGQSQRQQSPRGAAVKYKNIVSAVCLGPALSCAQQAAQARGGIAIDFSPSARGNDFGSTAGTFGVIEVAN